MTFTINTPNGEPRIITMSKAMESHFNIPINHANTILNQINSGMYARFFEGKKDLVCMDFGANVGLVSLYMLPACKELYSIEPTPAHFALLVEVISKRFSDCFFMPYVFALSETESDVVFMTGHSTENKITSKEGYGNGKITVEGKPLSWFIAQAKSKIDFCKVDIEGGEMKALTIEQLKNAYGKVKTFFVEVHPAYGGGMEDNMRELTERFMTAGYEVEILDYQTIVAQCE